MINILNLRTSENLLARGFKKFSGFLSKTGEEVYVLRNGAERTYAMVKNGNVGRFATAKHTVVGRGCSNYNHYKYTHIGDPYFSQGAVIRPNEIHLYQNTRDVNIAQNGMKINTGKDYEIKLSHDFKVLESEVTSYFGQYKPNEVFFKTPDRETIKHIFGVDNIKTHIQNMKYNHNYQTSKDFIHYYNYTKPNELLPKVSSISDAIQKQNLFFNV